MSNLDTEDMKEASTLSGGDKIAINHVLYNFMRRGIAWDLLPCCRERSIPVMAYSPIGHSAKDQKNLFHHPAMQSVASRHGATPAQVALTWLLCQQGNIAIPKASNPVHVRENQAALDISLTEDGVVELDKAFPPPAGKSL